jgi:hypothetical protein
MKRLSVVLGGVCLVASSVWAGVAFESKVNDGAGRTIALTRGWVDDAKARIDYLKSTAQSGVKRGSYLLTKDGGQTIYMVDAENKSYLKMDIDKLASKVGDFMNAAGAFVRIKFSNPKFKTVLNERGPKLFGLPTRHIKTETSYTVTAFVFGRRNVSKVARQEEMWVTTKLKDRGMQIWTQQRHIKTGNKDLDKMIEAETSRIKGVPLKIKAVTKTTQSNGKTETSTMVSEITALKMVRVPAKTFEIPADYKNNNEELAAGFNELKRQVQEADKSKHKEGTPTESINKLMNGFFGGKK